jgi:hypothetical protein
MNTPRQSNDNDVIEDLEDLQSRYQKISVELPDVAIDRQIIAAAQQELSQPNKKPAYKISWWRRLSLPLFITATFTFTAIATHWLWPTTPMKTLPGTAPATISFEVAEPVAESVTNQKRQPRPLPQQQQVITPPDAPVTLAFSKSQSQPPLLKLSQFPTKQLVKILPSTLNSPIDSHAPTAGEKSQNIAKLSLPDREVWVREIIDLYKQGEFVQAKKSLVKFKQKYPDYPIDEQLEVFK